MPDYYDLAPVSLSVPILLLIFNRPDSTQKVFEAIRQARPTHLYLAADGPRPDRPNEAALCGQTRAAVLEHIDWPCEVHTLLRSENLGSGLGVSEAISWFFAQQPEGIVLEDDCLPSPAFFTYCQQLLARYRNDSRVMHIGGNNFSAKALLPQPEDEESYFFSRQVQSWGWASWRRAWEQYDFELHLLPVLRKRGLWQHLYSWWPERLYWLNKFEPIANNPYAFKIWDYQWHFAIAAQSGLAIVPAVNLVQNIGFGQNATHTFEIDEQFSRPAMALRFPLHHPPAVLRDWSRDRQHFREFLVGRFIAKARRASKWLRPRGVRTTGSSEYSSPPLAVSSGF